MASAMGLLQYKEIQIYNEETLFWMALPSRRRSWTLANILLSAEFRLVATNFIYTYLHDGTISVCIDALVVLEILKDRVWSNVQAIGLLFPRGQS